MERGHMSPIRSQSDVAAVEYQEQKIREYCEQHGLDTDAPASQLAAWRYLTKDICWRPAKWEFWTELL